MNHTLPAELTSHEPQPPDFGVEIEGLPIYDGTRLCPDSVIFRRLRTVEQFAEFARRIRGPFSIIVRQAGLVTAITDFGACFPIYWIEDPVTATVQIASRIATLRNYSRCELSPQAFYWWTVRYCVGPQPFYADVNQVKSATIFQIFHGRRSLSVEYIDWTKLQRDGPKTYEDAREAFVQIATSYIAAVAKPDNRVACFLSGGVDSAICAYLAKLAGVELICLTADYAMPRYSEFDAAARTASMLQLQHQSVRVDYRANRRAIFRMNTPDADIPVSHSQLTSLLATGDAAIELGLQAWLTGDNAGPIFLEFDTFYQGLPSETKAFADASRRMTFHEYIARTGKFGSLDAFGAAVLRCVGLDPSDCEEWIRRSDSDTTEKSALFQHLGYPLAVVAEGQRFAGPTHQNCWLPAQRAASGNGQILSPFLDIEMIRFALSLPLNLKYRDGVAKWFLREFLKKETGLVAPKIASPNPSRIWWWPPRPDDLSRIDPRLRNLVFRWQLRNALDFGRHYKRLIDISSLGIWLAAHRLEL